MKRISGWFVGALVLGSLVGFYMAERTTETPIMAEHLRYTAPNLTPTIVLPEMIIVGELPHTTAKGAAMKGEPMPEVEWDHELTQGGPGSVKITGFEPTEK